MKKDYLILKHGHSMDDEKVEVYFLESSGPMANWKGDGTHDNPYIVDEETAKALIEDNYDPAQELKEEMESQVVFDCSAGVPEPFNPLAGVEHFDNWENEGGSTQIGSCCPIGHKGHEGWPPQFVEEEWLIMKVLNQLRHTQFNIASETAREFLAKEIAKDLRAGGFFK